MDHVAGMIAAALYPTPLGAWLVPDLDQRGKVLAAVTKIWIEHAMFYGDIYLSADGGITAAAVCFHRYRPLPPPANYPTRLADAAGPHTNQFAALDNIIANNQPTEAHYHLAYLAAHPHHQRSRLGTALMAHLRSTGGSVPCAGRGSPPGCGGWDHPRVRGEQSRREVLEAASWGSPPRARGAARLRLRARRLPGITPACAGSRTRAPVRSPSRRDHPRVRGEQAAAAQGVSVEEGSPPRARGADALP